MEENNKLKRIIDIYVDKGANNEELHEKMMKTFNEVSKEEREKGYQYLNWKLQASDKKVSKYSSKIKVVLEIVLGILILLGLLIRPMQILIAKKNIAKDVKENIVKNIEYEKYEITGKYYNTLNIQMKDEFEEYDYSKKKSIVIDTSEKFKNEYKNYEKILIDKNGKEYVNDTVKNITDTKVILSCKDDKYTYTIYKEFKKNDKEYKEEDSLKEYIIKQLENYENKDELVEMINSTKYSKETLDNIINIQDITEKYNEIIYRTAIINNANYKKEIELLEKIPEYKDSRHLISDIEKLHELDGEWHGGGYTWIINGKLCYNVYSNYSYEYAYNTYYCKYENNILYIFNNEPQMNNLDNAVFKMEQNDGKLTFYPYSFSRTKTTLSKVSDNTKPGDIIKKSEPSIGMTKTEVENSTWGKPERINKTTTAYGVTEQWCYQNYKYIYFKNGVVTSIHD